MGEWLIILLIVLLVFGAGKLPDIGDALGRSIRNFKRASAGDEEIEVSKKPAKEVSAGKKVKEIEEPAEGDDDDEFEEVVVRRKKQKTT
ncbi:MAG TPA: twin-arginine translocase TatA/TatE family subunit [Kofleriaceae bacterium]|jgi:sec-independent protein translocase protein TatA|nr:twin-arginine translocase TatA/TatE family subunit [Kofleriaceae bacterium]